MRALSSYSQVLVVATAGLAGPCAMAADADHGFDLAKCWCGHVPTPRRLPPSRKADFTPEKVAFFLLDPHPKMPNFPLSRSEAGRYRRLYRTLRK
jgi:hypothetical protein